MDKELNLESFKREYQCLWETNSIYDKAYELWCEYYYETEKYDRSVCSHFNNYGVAVPMSYEENRLIQRNSRVWWEYTNKAKLRLEGEIDKETWDSARNSALRLSWIGLQEWNERRNKICQL